LTFQPVLGRPADDNGVTPMLHEVALDDNGVTPMLF
jgi:hypothetical protein